MSSAQTALEYLIIIAAVLGLSAAIVMIVSSSFSAGATSAAYNACKEAAAQCKVSRYVSIKDPCLGCIQACSDLRTGQELFTGAVNCCNSTLVEKIYAGSPGCAVINPELVYDDFANLNAWQGSISNDQWHINSTYGYNNSNAVMKGWTDYTSGGGYAEIRHPQSTVGFNSIRISFWSSRIFQAPGYLSVDASADGGTGWLLVSGQMSTNESTWTYHSYLLPSEFENNPNFVVRISSVLFYSAPSVSSYVAVDDFRIVGDSSY